MSSLILQDLPVACHVDLYFRPKRRWWVGIQVLAFVRITNEVPKMRPSEVSPILQGSAKKKKRIVVASDQRKGVPAKGLLSFLEPQTDYASINLWHFRRNL